MSDDKMTLRQAIDSADDVDANVVTEEWSTDRLHETTYLRMRGIQHLRLDVAGVNCCWVFAETEDLTDEVAIYRDGEASVNPREFYRVMNEVKREMFEFLDSNKAKAHTA